MKKIIIIGAGGHGKVVADLAIRCGFQISGFLDDDLNKREVIGFPVLGLISDMNKYISNYDYEFVIGIGNNKVRKIIAEKHKKVMWATLVHPTAVIGMAVKIQEGTVVMPNAVVNVDTTIGRHCIINTGAIIEHDNIIGDYAHISPNAVLGGTVNLGEGTQVGIGATVINNISICDNCIIGAGGTVVKDIVKEGTYVGVPARRMSGR